MSDLSLELLKLSTSPYIELLEIDISFLGLELTELNLSTCLNEDGSNLVFNSKTYSPWPFNIEGISLSAEGAPARPTVTFGNLDANKIIGNLAFQHGDLVGANITYIRTFAKYLGGSGGISAAKLKFVFGKVVTQTKSIIQFELRSPLDRELAYLPSRRMLDDFPGLNPYYSY